MIELTGYKSDKIIAAGNMLTDSVQNVWVLGVPDYFKRCYLNFKFIVFIKEGKLKYHISNFSLPLDGTHSTDLEQMGDNVFSSAKQRQRFKVKNTPYLDRKIKIMINHFIQYMQTEDW